MGNKFEGSVLLKCMQHLICCILLLFPEILQLLGLQQLHQGNAP